MNISKYFIVFFFFSSRRRHTRWNCDWSSDVCSSDLGPQAAGLLLGEKRYLQAAWINSAPHHAFGRSLKVGKEEIMGMLAAVEMWVKRDHKAEWAQWESWLDHIATSVKRVPGVTTKVNPPSEGLSNRTPELVIEWNGAKVGITGQELNKTVLDTEPRIVLSR